MKCCGGYGMRLHKMSELSDRHFSYRQTAVYIRCKPIQNSEHPESAMTKQSLNNILKFFILKTMLFFSRIAILTMAIAMAVRLVLLGIVGVSSTLCPSQHHIHQWPETTVIHSVLYCLSLRITLYLVLYSISHNGGEYTKKKRHRD